MARNMCTFLSLKSNFRSINKFFSVIARAECQRHFCRGHIHSTPIRFLSGSCITHKLRKLRRHHPSEMTLALGLLNPVLSPMLCSGYSTDKTVGTSEITQDILKDREGKDARDRENTDTKQSEDEKSESSSNESKKKKESWFSGKHAWKLGLLSLAGMGLVMCGNLLILWGAPLKDKDGQEITDEFSDLSKWKAYMKRATKEFHFFKQMIQDPSSTKLLPDPLKEPYYQPPYTLVLEMTGVLVHPDWTLNTGWRFKKRPGVDYFLQQVGPPLFEVVIFTREQGFTAFPIIDGLDPHGYVSYRLFRDATRYVDGHHIKDLDCLNRDLSKVILVDCDPEAFILHPRNAIGLRKWSGKDDDRTLIDLANFLRTVASSGVEDVRPVLEHYGQFENPLGTFKENQRRLQEEQEKKTKLMSEQMESKSLAGGWSAGLSGRRR